MADEHIREIVREELLALGVMTYAEMTKGDQERRQAVTDVAAARAAATNEAKAASDVPLPPGTEVPDKFSVSKGVKPSKGLADTPAAEIEGNVPPATPEAAKSGPKQQAPPSR